MKEWFMGLAPRERLMVIVAAGVVALVLIYLLAWVPLAARTAHLEQDVAEQQTLKQWMQRAAAEARQLRGSTAAVNGDQGRSLLAVVDETAKQAKLGPAVKRIQPEGQDLVRVSLEHAPFDDVVIWLAGLQQSQGVSVVDATVDRQPTTGQVNARITLKKAS
jgi:general secretion pathway protein M